MNYGTAPVLDLSKTPLARDYPSDQYYIKIIDGVFTPDECKSLIRFAEIGVFDPAAAAPAPVAEANKEKEIPWAQAGINYGLQTNQQYVDTEYRNSGRILRFDDDVAAFVYARLLPHVSDVVEIKPGDKWHCVVGLRSQETWRMVGVNERLSFLKYGPGQFFKEHCDGQPVLPDGRRSRITLQIYLNGDGQDGVVGGATRIWSFNKKRWYDVEPRVGRVLIFQQQNVLHSGEEVKEGIKYALRSDFLYRTQDE